MKQAEWRNMNCFTDLTPYDLGISCQRKMVPTRVAFILTETTADCKHKNICDLYVMCYELLSSMSHSELGKLTSSAPSARHAKMQTPWTFDQCRQYQQTGRSRENQGKAEMIWTISRKLKKLKKHAPIFYNKLYAPTAMGQWGGSHRIARFNRESCIRYHHFVSSRARNYKTLNLLGSENASRNIPWLEQAQPCGDWAPRVWMFIIFHSGSMLWLILQK